MSITEQKEKDWHLMEFSTPITESAIVNDEFIIKGTAITETTTHNNHKYIAEELQKAAPSMQGKPLLIDHNNSVESIKGKVSRSYFDVSSKSIKFEAKVMDKQIREMIKDGRITNVSIGAFAEDLMREEDTGAYIAKGINIAELSLVAVPADENASFAMAMANSISLKEKMGAGYGSPDMGMEKCKECGDMVPKDQMKKHIGEKHPKKEESYLSNERRLNEMTEETNVQEAVKLKAELETAMSELNALKAERRQNLISEYKTLCSEKKVKEKDMSNVSEETLKLLIEQLREITVSETKTELKSVVAEKQMVEGIDNFMIERSESGNGYAIWAMPDSKGRISLK